MDEQVVSLLGSVLIQQLLLAATSRAEVSRANRVPVSLYADEFHRFATRDFATLFGRNI